MRHKKKRYAFGETRKRTAFLFTPLTLRRKGDWLTEETRWLETATWEEEWYENVHYNYWNKLHWIEGND